MLSVLRRWFGLRCAIACCPCIVDREQGRLVARCVDCGCVRIELSKS